MIIVCITRWCDVTFIVANDVINYLHDAFLLNRKKIILFSKCFSSNSSRKTKIESFCSFIFLLDNRGTDNWVKNKSNQGLFFVNVEWKFGKFNEILWNFVWEILCNFVKFKLFLIENYKNSIILSNINSLNFVKFSKLNTKIGSESKFY